MEESVAVGRDAAGAVGDRLAETAAGIDGREFGDQAAIGIGMRGWSELEHIGAGRFYCDRLLRSGQRQVGFDPQRHGIAHGNVVRVGEETRHGDFQVVGIRRDINQAEGAIGAAGGGLHIVGHGIVERDDGFGNGCAGGIEHTAFYCARVAEGLAIKPAHGLEYEDGETQDE